MRHSAAPCLVLCLCAREGDPCSEGPRRSARTLPDSHIFTHHDVISAGGHSTSLGLRPTKLPVKWDIQLGQLDVPASFELLTSCSHTFRYGNPAKPKNRTCRSGCSHVGNHQPSFSFDHALMAFRPIMALDRLRMSNHRS